jgi:hypothetical protein
MTCPTASMSFVDEVRHVGEFLVEQGKVLGAGVAPVMTAQAIALVSKINQLVQLDPATATQLTATITNGPWDIESKQKLAFAVADRMRSCFEAGNQPTARAGKTATQHMQSFQLYLSQSDITYFEDKNVPFPAKLVKAADICLQLGLTFPTCVTCGHVVTVIKTMAGGDQLTGKEGYDRVQDFKKYLKSGLKRNPVAESSPTITLYPTTPHDLPIALFQKVYAHDPPNTHVWHEDTKNNLVLRKNHRDVRSDSDRANVFAASPINGLSAVLSCFQQMMNNQNHGGSSGSGGAGIDLLNFAPPRRNNQLALAPSPEPPRTPEPTPDPAPPMTLALMPPALSVESLFSKDAMSAAEQESIMTAAMLARKEKAIADKKAAADSSDKIGAIKRPASSKIGVIKRPASAKENAATEERRARLACKIKMPSSIEKRVEYRPNGCGKCRNKPGCSPSCWK